MVRLVSLVVLATLAGCVSAPRTFSARSAASAQASPAPRVAVGRALTEEPPAPGASTEGWAGLAAPAEGMPAHHHHHPGTTMPMTEPSDAH